MLDVLDVIMHAYQLSDVNPARNFESFFTPCFCTNAKKLDFLFFYSYSIALAMRTQVLIPNAFFVKKTPISTITTTLIHLIFHHKF